MLGFCCDTSGSERRTDRDAEIEEGWAEMSVVVVSMACGKDMALKSEATLVVVLGSRLLLLLLPCFSEKQEELFFMESVEGS